MVHSRRLSSADCSSTEPSKPPFFEWIPLGFTKPTLNLYPSTQLVRILCFHYNHAYLGALEIDSNGAPAAGTFKGPTYSIVLNTGQQKEKYDGTVGCASKFAECWY